MHLAGRGLMALSVAGTVTKPLEHTLWNDPGMPGTRRDKEVGVEEG